MIVYVIVENVSVVIDGAYDTVEALCPILGYFTDEKLVEAKVNQLNAQEDQEFRAWMELDDDDAFDGETRFGYIPLESA